MSIRQPVSVPRLLMALSSAALLVVAFPNFNQPRCAWLALIPWLIALRTMNPGAAFGCSYLVGLVFFLGSLWWLLHVTVIGLVALCAFLALYPALFGLLVAWLKTRARGVARVGLLASAWVALEYLRSRVLSGFGWNLLGYSQAPVLSVIQIADLTGVWGVSFLIVLVNVALADYLNWRNIRKGMTAIVAVIGVLVASWLYGAWRLRHPVPADATVRVAVVQGNVPQEQKWDARYRDTILERYERLTRDAIAQHPDLIVWPEASVPGMLGVDQPLTERITRLTREAGVPVLLGAPLVTESQGQSRFTNSAVMLGLDGGIRARYDKVHLVPFGEFVPLSDQWPWLREVLPPIGDFVPGHEYTVFETRDPSQTSDFRLQTSDFRPETRDQRQSGLQSRVSGLGSQFSVLICFEDIFPELSRRFAREGAQWLVTITNDAWFGKTGAPYQHAQASTFRAVELRLPMVRAANTGWSGCMDASGRWTNSVRDAQGQELFIEGVATCEVAAPSGSRTLYARFGDWFAWACLLITGWRIVSYMRAPLTRRSRKRRIHVPRSKKKA